MRVLLSVPLYPPFSRVGAWMATHEYMAALAGRGHVVDVVPYQSGHAGYTIGGVRVHTSGTDLLDRADLVVGHLGGNQVVAENAKRKGIPLVQFAHSTQNTTAPTADLLVCNSHATAKVIDYPSIVGRPVLHPELHRTTPGDRVTLVNLSADKGGDLLRILAPAMPATQFLAVRGGYGRQVTTIGPNVETIRTTENMRGDVWSHTRILMCPSLHESWGMVGLEAMTSGIPVIAHPTDGLRESLGGAGIFVDRGDLAGWRHQITRLQDPDEWAAASASALERVTDLPDDREAVCDAMERTVPCLAFS